MIGGKRIVWPNLTGSGNGAAAHVQTEGRMALMFCAFEGRPRIRRVHGSVRVSAATMPGEAYADFAPLLGARQFFVRPTGLVQTSCWQLHCRHVGK